MLNFLKNIKDQNNHLNEVSQDEKNILIISLLIECAKGDYDFSDDEIKKIKNLIKNKLKIEENKVESLFNDAIKMTQNNVEIYSLTRDIRENFEKEKILEIFSFMWEVVLADGKIDDFELALMTKLTGLFHLTGKEAAQAKLAATSS